MSSYRGRNNVNVSQFLANLNTIQPVEEQVVDTFNPDDLALFTNTQFFDFDMGDQQQIEELSPTSTTYESQNVTPEAKRTRISKDQFNADDAIDSFLGAGFDYDYSSILQTGLPDQRLHTQPPVTNVVAPAMPLSTHTSFHHDARFPIPQTNIAAPVHSQPPTPSALVFPSPASTSTSKRKASSVDPLSPECLEEASRLAAEEDKRRRNTAASARFRIKKKQREQALERSAKEMAEKVSSLESKITQLEMENKWLKNLITEKNTGKKDELDITELYKAKFSAAASAPAPLLKDNKSTI